jgi:hypothetical protein
MSRTHAAVSRRRFLAEVAAVGAMALPVGTRRAHAQPKATISFWNGLTGADGKVMAFCIGQKPARAAMEDLTRQINRLPE